MGTAAVKKRAGGAAVFGEAIRRFEAAGIESARLDAEILMAEAAGITREDLLAVGCEPDKVALVRFGVWMKLRERRCPIAYIVGHKEFFSLNLAVTRDVLVPRPETERLVEAALEALADNPQSSVLDLGTGSGAIAIAIAHNAPLVRVTATDVSPAALEISRENARVHGLSNRIDFIRADLFRVVGGGTPIGRFNLIVSNPPYIAEGEIDSLAPEVSAHEPRFALAGGPDGLEFHRRIAAGARAHLLPEGMVLVEIGEGQGPAVVEIFKQAGFSVVSVLNDLGGRPRVVRALAA
jgi:release factor glutamine methyltransferase